MTLGEALRAASLRLAPVSDSPRLDAELLLAEQFGGARGALLARESAALDAAAASKFETLLKRREAGEPVAYLLGRKGFWTLDLQVSADVLIPRPETELLVEWVLEKLDATVPSRRDAAMRIADLGTGSGAIALALASELPASEVIATDLSPAALDLADRNARSNRLRNLSFVHGCWFGALERRCTPGLDLIVSNPPYVAVGDPHLPALRFEPIQALVAGADGLDDLRTIVGGAGSWLRPGGWLFVEHGHDQAAAVCRLFVAAGFVEVETRRDLGGQERATAGRWA